MSWSACHEGGRPLCHWRWFGGCARGPHCCGPRSKGCIGRVVTHRRHLCHPWLRAQEVDGAGFALFAGDRRGHRLRRSEEHTSELQSLMRISYAVFCLKKKKQHTKTKQ